MIDRLFLSCRVGGWQVLAAVVLLVGLAFARAPLRQIPDALFVSDGFGYYVYLPSLILDGDLDLSNELARIPHEGTKAYFAASAATGRPTNPFPIGPALLWLPFFLLAHGATAVMGLVGLPVRQDGFGFWYELPVYCGAFAYGLAACWLIHRLVTQLFSREIAGRALFAVLFCTPLAYYLWFEPNMAHAAAAFAIALFVYALWISVRAATLALTAWMGVGMALGIVALIRPYNAAVALALIPAVWYVARVHRRSMLIAGSRLIVAGAMAAIVFLPQVLVSRVLYGRVLLSVPNTGYDRMRWMDPDLSGVCISIASFFPLIVLALAGLLWRRPDAMAAGDAIRSARRVVLAWVRPLLLVGLGLTIYVIASFPGWPVGEALGQRRLVDWSLPLALGFATVIAWVPSRWTRVRDAVLIAGGAAGGLVTALYVVKLLPDWGLVGAGW